MTAVDCLIISLISVAWGCIWFSVGDVIRNTTTHDNLGFFIQVVGTIFIAAPIAIGILVLSLGIIICMFYVVKAAFGAII